MNAGKLREIHIENSDRQRPGGSFWTIILGVLVITAAGAFFAWPRKNDDVRVVNQIASPKPAAAAAEATPALASAAPKAAEVSDSVLTVSGYIVNRARIELSPRFQGVVKWIAVKKGDAVAKDEVVVMLDDAEQKAHLLEAEGRVGSAKAAVEKAQIALDRAKKLRAQNVEPQEFEDYARIALEAANGDLEQAEGGRDYARSELDWTQIRSPIDGVVLEKLVDPGELVTPQSFGGTRGPSTAVLAVADPHDLQVEIDINESDLAKVFLGQKCKVSPEAYADRSYDGYIAEIAPEANRQKGTLQIKVQIANPDRYLTPELSAKVDFLKQ